MKEMVNKKCSVKRLKTLIKGPKMRKISQSQTSTANTRVQDHAIFLQNSEKLWKPIAGILDSGSTHTVGSYQLLNPYLTSTSTSPLVQANLEQQRSKK